MNNKDMPVRTMCSYADKYKAERKPRCSCIACENKYKAALAELEKRNGQYF